MNVNEKNLELQVQIWALIGPLISIATIITLYSHDTPQNLILGAAVLVGTLACWWWKTKGLIGALAAITLLGAYQFLNHNTDDSYWNIGITCAIALTFLVTALSYEEVEAIVVGMQSESSSRLKSLLKLDEKLEKAHIRLNEQKKSLTTTLDHQQQTLRQQERLVELAREDINSTQERHEELLKQFHELKTTDQPQPCPDLEVRRINGMYKQLRQQFEEKSSLLDATRKELFHTQEKLTSMQIELRERQYEVTDVERELQRCLAELERDQKEINYSHKKEVEQLQDLVATLMKGHS